eukprot:scaffold149526_cov17-Tisochrysis_lutea.AAC.1
MWLGEREKQLSFSFSFTFQKPFQTPILARRGLLLTSCSIPDFLRTCGGDVHAGCGHAHKEQHNIKPQMKENYKTRRVCMDGVLSQRRVISP